MIIEGQPTGRKTRQLTYGMVGGGPGAFIGDVHRKAIAMDAKARIVCGCFSQKYENTLSIGDLLDLPQQRLYTSYREMIREEAGRKDRMDFVVIVTPNVSHYPIARLALESGFHVVCDKPLTTSSRDAQALKKLASENGLFLCVTYAYSSYPMIKHLKAMITEGELGEIRFVNAEYPQEWLATPLEKTGQKQSAWRTDPSLSGVSNCTGDIGSHIENIVSYLTGLEIKSLCARLDIFGEGRVLDDNASVMVNYAGGAKGLYWSSQIAIGHNNGFKVRIYGTKGSVEWIQENPDSAKASFLDRPACLLSRGRDSMSHRARSLSRLPSGHPEGYFECFANLYSAFIGALAKKIEGEPLTSDDLDFPSADDGIRGVRYIERCVESSSKGAVWLNF